MSPRVMHIVRQLRGWEHTFAGEKAAGRVAPDAPPTAGASERTVQLDVWIEHADEGYILQWEGPSSEYSGEQVFPELRFAEHAAEEIFGIARDDWDDD